MTQQNQEGSSSAGGSGQNLEDLLPKDVYTLIKYLIASLAEQAWTFMGLHMNPHTKSITKDLVQARLAIDCAVSLNEKLSPFLSEKEKAEFMALIQNLQMNYVQQSS